MARFSQAQAQGLVDVTAAMLVLNQNNARILKVLVKQNKDQFATPDVILQTLENNLKQLEKLQYGMELVFEVRG